MITQTQENGIEIVIADSVGELTDAVVKAAQKKKSVARLVRWADSDFTGREFASVEHVARASSSPWPEGLAIVESMLDELRGEVIAAPVSRRRRVRFSDSDGSEVDYDRLRAGGDFWRTSRRENARGPQTFTVVNDMTAFGSVSPDDVLWRGAASIALTYLLESAGYRVELWTARSVDDCFRDGTGLFLATCVKRTSDPLDVGACITAVSAWFYRTIGFGAAGLVAGREPMRSGRTPTDPSRFVSHVTTDANAMVVKNVWSYASAVEFIRRSVASLN